MLIIHPFLLWRGTNTNPGAAAIRTLQCQSCRSHLHQISDRETLISNSSMKWRNIQQFSPMHYSVRCASLGLYVLHWIQATFISCCLTSLCLSELHHHLHACNRPTSSSSHTHFSQMNLQTQTLDTGHKIYQLIPKYNSCNTHTNPFPIPSLCPLWLNSSW